jgi:hypothetical protein
MPILERDPWRLQYFEHVPCPDEVVIPTDDPDCWLLYPRHRWVYDKLKVAESQGLPCGPHGVSPLAYPVFSKPMVNLKGMGIGSRVIADAGDMEHASTPGHMWMVLLEGPHVSSDCAVLDGRLVWVRHATGVPWIAGTFKYWTIHAAAMPPLEAYLREWIEAHMAGYSGMMNFETIGGRIIEAHLRFADQWCDLYGAGWVEALVQLYSAQRWQFDDSRRRDGFSVPLFARHGNGFRHPPMDVQADVRAMPHIGSLQVTFHETKASSDHPMPPGGFRLAVVNATDLGAAHSARRLLAQAFAPDVILDQGD